MISVVSSIVESDRTDNLLTVIILVAEEVMTDIDALFLCKFGIAFLKHAGIFLTRTGRFTMVTLLRTSKLEAIQGCRGCSVRFGLESRIVSLPACPSNLNLAAKTR
jgi:hypothetical protein